MRTSFLFASVLFLGLTTAISAATAAEYPWQQTYAKVDPKGDLAWQPEAFRFVAGSSVRYIDFEKGDDGNDGTTKAAPWKRHPGDPEATGKAKAGGGAHTYVFKRGVTYRGRLVLEHSGTVEQPVRLTSDPEWGAGEAVICGSEAVTGWRQGAAHRDIPDADKVWTADLPFAPRSVWMVARDGTVTRIPIARTPNWTVSDPEDTMSEWWVWEQPKWWEQKNKMNVKGKPIHLGIDKKNLTRAADYYQDALVWTEWGIVMGTPFPTRVEAVDAEKKGLAFQGIWMGDSGTIITNNRYYLEDKPHYLDAPGEHWFEKKGTGGRLHLRLPGDADPNTVRIEAARHYSLVEDLASAKAPNRLDVIGEEGRAGVNTTGLQHAVISGLTFQFTHQWWDLEFPAWMHKEVNASAIRLRGSCDDVRIANCRFLHVTQGVQIEPINRKTHNGGLAVCDNEFLCTDDAAISIGRGEGTLRDAQVLRNKLHLIGLRPNRQSSGHALNVLFPVTMHVAGNMLTRCYGAGLFLFGGKGSGEGGDVPFARYFVHHNKAEQTLLQANDWGGIETWQGGPFYVYNNISANPNGLWNWAANKPFNARLGYAYYLDGGFKNYLFNNIAWGLNNEARSRLCNNAAFQEAVPTIHNSFVNNTVYRFAKGSNWSPRGGHHRFLGNVWSDIGEMVFTHGQLKEDKSPSPVEYPHEYMAYGSNVFHAIRKDFGHFENLVPENEKMHPTFDSFRAALARRKALDPSLGLLTETPPLRDPANRDLRPAEGSAAIDKGVTFFVPWGLCATVGEWHFYPLGNDPAKIPDEHWYMTDYHVDREAYHALPQYPLTVVNVGAEHYIAGPLEDWIRGALQFDGKDRYAVAKQAEIARPFEYEARPAHGRGGKAEKRTAQGPDLKNMDIHASNFLIEIYFKTPPGHTGGTLVRKMADAGYALNVNEAGGVTFTVRGGGASAELKSAAKTNDGNWHHLIAECDRASAQLVIYLDGKKDAAGKGVGPDAVLANGADFLVGGGPGLPHLAGAIDFLRLCQGTLADAQTTIEELYAWEFDGPHLRDFAGRKPNGRRDAGAIEADR